MLDFKKAEADSSESIRPMVFDYWSLRSYLKDIISYLKKYEGLSGRKIAKEAGLPGSGTLSLILSNKRPISLSVLKRLDHVLQIPFEERKCFYLLFEYDYADTEVEKRRLQIEIIAAQKNFRLKKIDKIAADFLGQWQYQALHEVLSVETKEEELFALEEQLSYSRLEIQSALFKLESLGLIKRSGDAWIRSSSRLQTSVEILSSFNRIYHREMISRASNAVDQVHPTKRELCGITVALSEQEFQSIRAKIQEFIIGLNARYGESSKPDAVYQINIQGFELLSMKKSS